MHLYDTGHSKMVSPLQLPAEEGHFYFFLPFVVKYTVSKLYLLFGSRILTPVLLFNVKKLRFKTKTKNKVAVM